MACGGGSKRIQRLEDNLGNLQLELDTVKQHLGQLVAVGEFNAHRELTKGQLAKKADLQAFEAFKAHSAAQHRALQATAEENQVAQELKSLRASQSELAARLQAQEQAVAQAASTEPEEGSVQTSALDFASFVSRHEALASTVEGALDLCNQQQHTSQEVEIRQATLEEQCRKLEKLVGDSQNSLECIGEELHRCMAELQQRQAAVCSSLRSEIVAADRQLLDLLDETMRTREAQQANREHLAQQLSKLEEGQHQLAALMPLKADMTFAAQQKALIEASQVSLMAVSRGQRELEAQLGGKADKEFVHGVGVTAASCCEHLKRLQEQLLQQGISLKESLELKTDQAWLDQELEHLRTLVGASHGFHHRHTGQRKAAGTAVTAVAKLRRHSHTKSMPNFRPSPQVEP